MRNGKIYLAPNYSFEKFYLAVKGLINGFSLAMILHLWAVFLAPRCEHVSYSTGAIKAKTYSTADTLIGDQQLASDTPVDPSPPLGYYSTSPPETFGDSYRDIIKFSRKYHSHWLRPRTDQYEDEGRDPIHIQSWSHELTKRPTRLHSSMANCHQPLPAVTLQRSKQQRHTGISRTFSAVTSMKYRCSLPHFCDLSTTS